eukprot:115740-Pyramimonas_sp.AAC.2
MTTGVFAYHLNYPPVWSKACGVPNKRGGALPVPMSHPIVMDMHSDATPLRAAEEREAEENEYTHLEPREQQYQATRASS